LEVHVPMHWQASAGLRELKIAQIPAQVLNDGQASDKVDEKLSNAAAISALLGICGMISQLDNKMLETMTCPSQLDVHVLRQEHAAAGFCA